MLSLVGSGTMPVRIDSTLPATNGTKNRFGNALAMAAVSPPIAMALPIGDSVSDLILAVNESAGDVGWDGDGDAGGE